MRRLAKLLVPVLATLVAAGCSDKKDSGDTTPPAAPVIASPTNGATLDTTDLVDGQVVFSGTAEAGALVRIELDAAVAGSVFASGDGTWSIRATVPFGAHTAVARATDAAGNVSPPSAAVAFTLSPRLASTLPAGSPLPLTSWVQSVADTAGLGEVFPGQANSWVLDRDYALAQGFGLQYQAALVLLTGTPTNAASHASLVDDVLNGLLDGFPYDQSADEAVFLTPLFTAADGVKTAAVSNGATMGLPALSGTYSAFLNGTSDSRMSRTLAITAGQTYTLSWSDAVVLQPGALAGADAAPHAPAYQVVLRDPATGARLGDPLFSTTVTAGSVHTATLPAGLPASVVLSFELRSASSGFAEIDDVALADGGGPVALENGDFESASLAPGWAGNAGSEGQNVRSAPRDVGALSITRTFYAPPGATWGRLVDVFENGGGTPVTTSAVYMTMLTVPAPHVAASGASLVAWDPDQGVRDVGIVAGDGQIVIQDGDPFAFVVHDLSVPAGGKVAIVHFVVQLGGADGGALPTDLPQPTDLECSAIAAGFPAEEAYAIDLEPGVLELVQNF